MTCEPRSVSFEGNELLIPLVRVRSSLLPWRVYVGTPLGGYSVVITRDGVPADKKLISRALTLVTESGVDSLELNSWPFAPVCDSNDTRHPLHETSVIDLAGGADAALAKMSGNSRRMAGQAERKGVTYSREAGQSAMQVYYGLLVESSARRGLSTPKLPIGFYEMLLQLGGNDVEIWIARYNGEAIAGIIALYGGMEVSIWSAATRMEFATLRPQNILNVAVIRAAVERGLRWYNLGASEGLPGVKRFKEGLGAEAVPYRTFTYIGTIHKWYSRVATIIGRKTVC